jgi:protein Mpv17
LVHAQEKLRPTMMANWAVWPLANFIAFRFLHQDMRILYANCIGVSPRPVLPLV